jgi:16S rRNA (adenine1518-N6/adenine1519-N6)-dimethyltransferase
LGRRLGQHFLARQSVLERIAKATCPEGVETVVEIGPGRGALTSHLLAKGARVIAIEIDPVLVHYLRAEFREEPRLTLVEGDVLKIDLGQWGRVAIAGNLPYYITSPILEKTLALGERLIQAVFLVQKEVAERLIAKPGTRDYGFLSVQTQLLSAAELLFTVPADAFRPRPKVDSAVVRLIPRAGADGADHAAFLEFAGRCFQYKRKTIRNNLLAYYGRERLDALAMTKKRAEQLSIAELQELHRQLA